MKCVISRTAFPWKGHIDMAEVFNSTTNATHGTGRRDKIWLADVVACFLLPDDLLQPFGNRFVGVTAAQQRAKVVLSDAKQAGSDLPIRGKADAIALAAKRLADRGNHANFT